MSDNLLIFHIPDRCLEIPGLSDWTWLQLGHFQPALTATLPPAVLQSGRLLLCYLRLESLIFHGRVLAQSGKSSASASLTDPVLTPSLPLYSLFHKYITPPIFELFENWQYILASYSVFSLNWLGNLAFSVLIITCHTSIFFPHSKVLLPLSPLPFSGSLWIYEFLEPHLESSSGISEGMYIRSMTEVTPSWVWLVG